MPGGWQSNRRIRPGGGPSGRGADRAICTSSKPEANDTATRPPNWAAARKDGSGVRLKGRCSPGATNKIRYEYNSARAGGTRSPRREPRNGPRHHVPAGRNAQEISHLSLSQASRFHPSTRWKALIHASAGLVRLGRLVVPIVQLRTEVFLVVELAHEPSLRSEPTPVRGLGDRNCRPVPSSSIAGLVPATSSLPRPSPNLGGHVNDNVHRTVDITTAGWFAQCFIRPTRIRRSTGCGPDVAQRNRIRTAQGPTVTVTPVGRRTT